MCFPKSVFLRQKVVGEVPKVRFPKSVLSSGKGHAIGVLEPQENPGVQEHEPEGVPKPQDNP